MLCVFVSYHNYLFQKKQRKMLSYITKRLILVFPTLLGVLLINFIIIQAAPGGPVEQTIAKMRGHGDNFTQRLTGQSGDFQHTAGNINHSELKYSSNESIKYQGARGLDPDIIKRIEKIYGFDKPAYERFYIMLKNYLTLNFDKSFFRDKDVIELIIERLPVSISLGLWTTLIIYLVSIPLGIKKAFHEGTKFDLYSTIVIVIGYAIPAFIFAVFLIYLFAGGNFLQIFPLRGLVSDNFEQLSLLDKIVDYIWHLTLPIVAMVIGGFASLTILCKNSFMEQIKQQYVLTAYAKGCSNKQVMYGHIFRNAMILVIAGFPSAFIGILFTGSFLVEVIFSLDGLGLLAFEATIARDYPVIFGSLFIFTLLGLILGIIGDIMYVLVDPRIDFNSR